MKKITFFLMALLLFVSFVNAKVRTQDEARQLAGTFLQKNTGTMLKAPTANNQISLSFQGLNIESGSSSKNLPLYYVYNVGESAGFVIVAADDRAKTILGYSDSGSFDINNIPENFKNWLNFYTKELTILSETPESNNSLTTTLNDETVILKKTKNSTNAAVAPLLGGIKWNQNSPYNDMCPVIDVPAAGNRAATGCVATAMAQVMKYYEWPVSGTGTNSYTTYTLNIPLSVNFSTTTYDWANMTDTYSSSSTQPQKDAVATLMYHCGVGTNMDYNTESGTSMNAMAYALINYFGYDANLQQLTRDYYTRSEWVAALKEEIDNSRPVLYSGSSNSGGHMFVCDGYDPNGLFHFNWGWGGLSNGYFEITALNPGAVGIGGGNGSGYNSGQAILTGVQEPDASTSPSYVLYMESLMESSVTSTTRTGSFNINRNYYFNYGMNDFEGFHGFALYNTSGLVQVIESAAVTMGTYSGWNEHTTFNVSIPESVPNGIYKLYSIYKGTSESDWQIVRGKVGTPNFITTTVTSTEIQFSTDDSVYPELTLNSLSVTGNLYQNKTGRFNVSITNTGGEYNSNLIVYLQLTSNSAINQQVTVNPANIATNETVDLKYYGNITVAPGEYYLVIYSDPDNDPSTNSYLPLLPAIVVNVLAEPIGTPALAMPAAMSFPNNGNVPKNNAVLTANITNTGSYFENKMVAFIFPEGGGSSLGYIGYQTAIVDAGETTTVTFSGSIDLPVGNYRIGAYYHNGSTWVAISPTANSLINFTLVNEVWTGNSNLNKGGLVIYPNPVTEKMFIFSEELIKTIKVYDLSGRQLLTVQPNRSGEIEVQVNALENGVYILQTMDAENNISKMKFIKK